VQVSAMKLCMVVDLHKVWNVFLLSRRRGQEASLKLWYILCINETERHQIPEDHNPCSSFWVKSYVQRKLTTY